MYFKIQIVLYAVLFEEVLYGECYKIFRRFFPSERLVLSLKWKNGISDILLKNWSVTNTHISVMLKYLKYAFQDFHWIGWVLMSSFLSLNFVIWAVTFSFFYTAMYRKAP